MSLSDGVSGWGVVDARTDTLSATCAVRATGVVGADRLAELELSGVVAITGVGMAIAGARRAMYEAVAVLMTKITMTNPTIRYVRIV